MRKKMISIGLLVGGATVAGLVGSAYAEDGTPSGKAATGPVAGRGPVAVACAGANAGGTSGGAARPGERGRVFTSDGKHPLPTGKPTMTFRTGGRPPALPPGKPAHVVGGGGKALPAPPSSGTGGHVTFSAKKGAHGAVGFGPLPKGVHCSTVKPGAPSPLPSR